MSEQIVIVDAGVPGAPNSYYSEEKTLEVTGDTASPPVAGFTVIPEPGFIFFADLPAGVSIVIRTDLSPETFVTLVAAGGQGQIWNDGTNIFAKNAAAIASPELTINYFVLQRKP